MFFHDYHIIDFLFPTNFPFTNLVGVSEPVSSTSTNVRLTDAPSQKTTQAVPRSPTSDVSTAAPTSNAAANPESGLPKTPGKGTID